MKMGRIDSSVNLTVSISEETGQIYQFPGDKYVNFICFGIILPIIVLFGMIGNIITIIILWQKDMYSNLVIYLRGLVITDSTILILSCITLTPKSLSEYTGKLQDFKKFIFPIVFTPSNFLLLTSEMINIWITVYMTVDRYIAISHLVQSARLLTRRKTFFLIWTITAVSIFYNLPHIFATKSMKSVSSEGYILVQTSYGASHMYQEVYSRFLSSVFIYIIPLSVLFVLNVYLMIGIRRMRELRIEVNSEEKDEANICLLVVGIISVFITCEVPVIALKFSKTSFSIRQVRVFTAGNILSVLNSSVKLLIYITIRYEFRIVLLRKFRRIRQNILGARQQEEFVDGDTRTSNTNDHYDVSDYQNGIKSIETTESKATNDISSQNIQI